MSISRSLENNPAFILENGIFYQRSLPRHSEFELRYHDIRRTEQRLYPDKIVQTLPVVPNNHPLAYEWKIRHRSLGNMLRYFRERPALKKFLEIGCGNGWLAHHLSTINNAEVCGVDINEEELRQAARNFNRPQLAFMRADVAALPFDNLIDVVILASSIQYFHDPAALLHSIRSVLTTGGEIHVIDSPLYPNQRKALQGQERSKSYFNNCNNAAMEQHYFHHTSESLNTPFDVLYNPAHWMWRLARVTQKDRSPFPWIRIRK